MSIIEDLYEARISTHEEFAEPQYLNTYIEELIANAVNDRNFVVVDRQQLDSIRADQNFQLSGEVEI